MSASPAAPVAAEITLGTLLEVSHRLIHDFGCTIQFACLPHDIGLFDGDYRIAVLDLDVGLLQQAQFLMACWSLCVGTPFGDDALIPVERRHHLSVVQDPEELGCPVLH